MRDTYTCHICPVMHPDRTPRIPHTPPVCDGDRRALNTWLGDIRTWHDILVNDEQPIIDQRKHERFGTVYFPDGIRHVFSRGMFPSDPVAALGGVAPINSRPKTPTVTGSRERPLPVNATALDLKAPARSPNLTDQAHPDDQIGHLSAATVLDAWVRDIRYQLYPQQHLPPTTVADLVRWLRDRLDDICDHYPDLVGFADALRRVRSPLRAAAGETEPRPELCIGVPCKQDRCGQLTLMRQPDGDIVCINPDCNAVLRPDEYDEWVKTAAKIEQHRHANNQHAPTPANAC